MSEAIKIILSGSEEHVGMPSFVPYIFVTSQFYRLNDSDKYFYLLRRETSHIRFPSERQYNRGTC